MKRLLCAMLILALATPVWALLGVQDDQNQGFKNVATKTVSLPADGTITDIGTFIPKDAVGARIYVFGSKVVFNTSTSLATGALFIGVEIASGSYLNWEGKQTDYAPNIHAAPNTTNAATATIVAW